jgi:Icc-related predicted phosphoesterase
VDRPSMPERVSTTSESALSAGLDWGSDVIATLLKAKRTVLILHVDRHGSRCRHRVGMGAVNSPGSVVSARRRAGVLPERGRRIYSGRRKRAM